MNRDYVVTLRTPTGVTLDLSSRIDMDDLGTFSEDLEEGLLELALSDFDITLHDEDGELEELLLDAEPGDRYDLWVDREIKNRVTRVKYERIFGGVLDLPYSIEVNRRDKTVSLRAFSYLKLLERSAEGVRRAGLDGRYANTTAADATTSMDTTSIEVDDKLTLSNGTVTETRTVISITNSTTLEVDDPWDTTFVFATVVVETPYYRYKSVPFLVGALLDLASLPDRSVVLGDQDVETPIVTAVNNSGLANSGVARNIYPDYITGARFLYVVMSTTGYHAGVNLTDGFPFQGGTPTPLGDWTPYLLTQPGSQENADTTNGDDGTRAFDHAGGFYYSIAWVTSGSDKLLRLSKDGVEIATVHTIVGYAALGWAEGAKAVDFNPATGHVWVSANWTLAFSGFPDGITRVWNGSSFSTLWSNRGGAVRSVAKHGVMIVQNDLGLDPTTNGELRVYRAPDSALLYTKTGLPFARLWTARAFGRFLGTVYELNGKTGVIVWRTDLPDWPQVFTAEVQGSLASRVFATVWQQTAGGPEHWVIMLDLRIYVLASYFAGVVQYADFSDASVSKALRDLAVVTGSYVTVDEYGVVRMEQRGLHTLDVDKVTDPTRDLGDPIEHTSIPVGEFYVRSVEVTGRDHLTGDDISVIVGDTGNSDNRFAIESNLIQSVALAYGVGAAYIGFFGKRRRLDEVTVEEPSDGRYRALEVVKLGGRRFLVVRSETTYADEEQELALLELTT